MESIIAYIIIIIAVPIALVGWGSIFASGGRRSKGRVYTSEEIQQMTRELQRCKTQGQKNAVLRRWRNS